MCGNLATLIVEGDSGIFVEHEEISMLLLVFVVCCLLNVDVGGRWWSFCRGGPQVCGRSSIVSPVMSHL